MKKQKDGENDIVGDSQTNDAVPDDSISKEPDGEVPLGHMDSRGAPEIVPEIQQLHQSDGLSGTSSTENVPEMQQLHQSDGLSGTSSTENGASSKMKKQGGGENDIVGDSHTNGAVPVPEIQQLHQSDGLSGISSTENVPEMQQLLQSDGLSGTSSTENVPKMQQLHQSDGLPGTSSTKNRRKYRTVQELKSVGIHFRPSETRQLSDMTIISGLLSVWLKLPRISIHKGTKSLLLNLVAFEACADLSSNFGVSSYVALMDTLIDCAEDVKELRSKGIIHDLLSNDEQVAKLFNEVGGSVVVVDYGICGRVSDFLNAVYNHNAFYNSRCSLWFTECLNNHCRSPWAVIGIVAAIVVVCLTISQTVFSAIQL